MHLHYSSVAVCNKTRRKKADQQDTTKNAVISIVHRRLLHWLAVATKSVRSACAGSFLPRSRARTCPRTRGRCDLDPPLLGLSSGQKVQQQQRKAVSEGTDIIIYMSFCFPGFLPRTQRADRTDGPKESDNKRQQQQATTKEHRQLWCQGNT